MWVGHRVRPVWDRGAAGALARPLGNIPTSAKTGQKWGTLKS